jgi:uncharacterized membrane protein
MALIGRLHPLLVHFPIALVMVAAAFEFAAIVTKDELWRTAAVVNVRAAAAFAFLAAIAGWRMASIPGATTSLLEWHRWLGTTAAVVTLGAAVATLRTARPSLASLAFRSAVFLAATLVAATGHLGGLMVWGTDFWNP